MKIVRLKGGLGNQMFQYVYAKRIEKETGDVVKLDLSAYSDISDNIRRPRIFKFNTSLDVASKEELKEYLLFDHSFTYPVSFKNKLKLGFEKILNNKFYIEKDITQYGLNKMQTCNYFDGYWQNPKEVDYIYDDIKDDFKSINKLSDNALRLKKEIESCNSVSIGFRRGDYITDKKMLKYAGITKNDYYYNAIDYIDSKVSNPIFCVFTNDIPWVKENIDFKNHKVVYVSGTDDDFEDFILLSSCKHNIITNSTFHWWGARLNEYEGKIIIAPKVWFVNNPNADIVPDRWIRL